MRYTITLSSEQAKQAETASIADGLRTGAWIAALVKRELARLARCQRVRAADVMPVEVTRG